MAKVYANLIIKGKKTINEVPEKLKKEVLNILKQLQLKSAVAVLNLKEVIK